MKNAIVATTTFARAGTHAERVRAGCALKTVESATKEGYRIVAVDGGSPAEYVEALKRRGARVLLQRKPGMGNARRQALREARDLAGPNDAIVWTEPEKYPLIPHLNQPLSIFAEGSYDLVMLRRTSLDSYPPEQALAYRLIALATKYLTGIDADFGWGPTILSKGAIEYYLSYESVSGDLWDSIHCPKLSIIKDGLRWTMVTINYRHPPEQTAAEVGVEFLLKRIRQVEQLVRAIEHEVDRLAMRVE